MLIIAVQPAQLFSERQQSLLFETLHTDIDTVCFTCLYHCSAVSCEMWDGDVAQLVECRTGMLLRQVPFSSAARDFSPKANFQCKFSISFGIIMCVCITVYVSRLDASSCDGQCVSLNIASFHRSLHSACTMERLVPSTQRGKDCIKMNGLQN